MSIKKLFNASSKNTNYLSDTNQKDAFEEIESSRNLEAIKADQLRYVPQVDYSDPDNFAKFGSARLYYKSAMTRILEYYPYDGSDAEINEFFNNNLDIENHILNTRYPRTNGYITVAADGYTVSSMKTGYGVPSTNEHIDLKGGPGTGSATSLELKELAPNPYTDSYKGSNVYDSNIYQTAGLPSTYGKGTRTSNLRANFEDGITVEFWMKTGSVNLTDKTHKQVIFDWWNNELTSSAAYSRMTIELTSSNSERPFLLTVQSGSSTNKNVINIGAPSLHSTMGTWNHYAIQLANTGSVLDAALYVNGDRTDRHAWNKYSLSSSFRVPTGSHTYSAAANLQGWWKLNQDLSDTAITPVDSSGKGRDGTFDTASDRPVPPTPASTPTAYIQTNSNTFGGDASDAIDIGTSTEWNSIVGSDGTAAMTFSAWVFRTGHGGGNYGRVIQLGSDLRVSTDNTNNIGFACRWRDPASGLTAVVSWDTGTNTVLDNEWTFITVTYDADNSNNNPIIYLNGVAASLTRTGADPAVYTEFLEIDSVSSRRCYIGNRYSRNVNWDGNLADIAVWDRALAATEVKAMYNASKYNKAHTKITELNPQNAMGRIGALIASPSGSTLAAAPSVYLGETELAGAGKLSGSLDEFRYWKTARNGKQIGENWFTQVRGGANTDISNTTLGIYYKFNEGITGKTSTDRIVLDYAGRVTNGFWTGYTANSRNTGSAMVLAGVAPKEYKDPVVRINNPKVLNLAAQLKHTGSSHDYNNNASLLSLVPGWVLDEENDLENTDLKYIAHIMGAYFDKLYLQISELPKIRQLNYPSSSAKPLPFAQHLPQSLGLYSPDLFVDATVLERFTNRDRDSLFESDLHNAKNLIYINLYNNLTHIFKSKGTETAIRNVLRCFNIDDKVLRLTINSNNEEFVLRDNYTQHLLRDSCVNFNQKGNTEAVVYQRSFQVPLFSNPISRGYLAGNKKQEPFGFTCEANVIFPYYDALSNKLNRTKEYNKCSIFGSRTVPERGALAPLGSVLQPVTSAVDFANFNVYVERESVGSRNAYFRLEATLPLTAGVDAPEPMPLTFLPIVLTSSTYFEVYNNEPWNLSVRVKPKKTNLELVNSGSSAPDYEIIFTGINPKNADIRDMFTVKQTLTASVGRQLIRRRKRLFVGADRVGTTGSVKYRSDMLVSSIKYWTKYLTTNDLVHHANDFENVGISGSEEPIAPLISSTSRHSGTISQNMLNRNTLALDWNFGNVTTSSAGGTFNVQDFSSGSSLVDRDAGIPTYVRTINGWVGEISDYMHNGYGYGFTPSSTNIIDKKDINTYKFISPEQVVSSDMIQLFSDEDVLFPNLRREEIVPNFVYSLEKSLYNAISDEMLDFMGGVVDFHSLIGAPVNRYRDRYKEMEKLRSAFFRRVSTVATVEKYMNYYKWFDNALTDIISQLVPASSEFVNDTLNIVESHVLERNKYQSRLNVIDSNTHDPSKMTDAALYGVLGALEDMLAGLSPPASSPRKTNTHIPYWKYRAERSAPEITSGDSTIDSQRDAIRDTLASNPHFSGTRPPKVSTIDGTRYTYNSFARSHYTKLYNINSSLPNAGWQKNPVYKRPVDGPITAVHGGTNFSPTKDVNYTLAALRPAGPIYHSGGAFVPQNVLLGLTRDLTQITDFKKASTPKNLIKKQKRVVKVQHGRDWEKGIGYKNVKSTLAFPFNIMSSSVKTGYNKLVVKQTKLNVEITNLHNDTYLTPAEIPLQGPFAESVVGGHQSRHVPINTGTDTETTRPEAWRILLGTCRVNPSGAIGMVGPDYPPPSLKVVAGDTPYPHKPYKKAYLYRDMVAKSPVNIKNIPARSPTLNKTVPGNYEQQYQVIHTFGAYANPRQFVETQPTLPPQTADVNHTTNIRTILGIHRAEQSHFKFINDYSTAYLNGTTNKTVITNRFAAPGGIEVSTRGYQDFKAASFSPYNALPYRNLTVQKPSQGPSGTFSEAPGGTPSLARVFDIHGKDYGLYSHAARHAARFGRDSLSVKDSIAGATYDQPPAMFKINRNLKERLKICNERTITYNQNIGIRNNLALQFGSGSTTSQKGKLYLAGPFVKDSVNVTGSTFTVSAWIKMVEPNTTNWKTIVSLGDNGGSSNMDIAFNWMVDASKRLTLWSQNASNKGKFYGSTTVTYGTWHHVAVTYDGSDAGNTPTFYIDGVVDTTNTDQAPDAAMTSINDVGSGNSYIGGSNKGNNVTHIPFKNDTLDEVAIYDKVLTGPEIIALYSNGGILNLTGAIAPQASALVTWIRFGDVAGDPQTVSALTVSAGTGGTFYDQMGNNDYIVKGSGGNATRLWFTSNSSPSSSVSVSYVSGTEEIHSYCTSPLYDNLNIQHQIPRADRQYMWIDQALIDVDNIRYAGFQKTFDPDLMPYRSTSAGLTPFFDFVVQSQATVNTFAQPTNRLTLVIDDPVSASSNTLGYPAGQNTNKYFNPTLIGTVSVLSQPYYLNNLLTSRGATYGWGWNKLRQGDHKILTMEQKRNELTITTDNGTTLNTFRLPPVSFKGRPAVVNVDTPSLPGGADSHVNNSFTVTNTNEKIFFNELELNNLTERDPLNVYLPIRDVIRYGQKSTNKLNWVLYTQNVFPSTRNEGMSGTVRRLGYDNLYWRNAQGARIALGDNTINSFGFAERYRDATPTIFTVGQSSWLLDAPVNFLTRSYIITGSDLYSGHFPVNPDYNTRYTQAGELQNTYFAYLTLKGRFSAGIYMKPAALFARKHALGSPQSVVSPQGPDIYGLPATGLIHRGGEILTGAFNASQQIPILGGEAVWEANTQAGIIERGKKRAQGHLHLTSSFRVSASNPWYNNYDAFNADLKLMARGYSIVPEYRMSEHIEDYYKYGISNKTDFDTFDIPGTEYSSSQPQFYRDFSNSDFLEGFLGIKAQSLLNAQEIRMVCSASIKYNAYKGFYPAQRTLDLVTQFARSHRDAFSAESALYTSQGNAAVFGQDLWETLGGLMKPVLNPLVSPGILYNSIKAGIAVDYPVVTDGTKISRGYYGGVSGLDTYALGIRNLKADPLSEAGYTGGQYWDQRIPFEAIIEPKQHVTNIGFIDNEASPSMSFGWTFKSTGLVNGGKDKVTASMGDQGDNIYSLMARNFFGEVGNFFLRNSEFTKLESNTVTDELRFRKNEVYMARIKLRRSHNGKRIYTNEVDSFNKSGSIKSYFTRLGARPSNAQGIRARAYYPLPQDPSRYPDFKETFTLYSRPTAFGPPCAGRPTGVAANRTNLSGAFRYALDSFEGYNPAFTPPYTNGEAWVDLIFRPSSSVTYDLERILSEVKTVSWRFDAGQKIAGRATPSASMTALIPIQRATDAAYTGSTPGGDKTLPSIYDGYRINTNSMQLSSSINIFGVERILEQSVDKFGRQGSTKNVSVGKKWIIQPKFETPMVNFADSGIHPIVNTNNTLTLPNKFSESVPRGIWHQFGVIPDDPKTGIFMEIEDIPTQWLKHHYKVLREESPYNNNSTGSAGNTTNLHRRTKSLASLCGFDKRNSSQRLGELKEKTVLREAVVAVPYILEETPVTSQDCTEYKQTRKKFISIPKRRFEAALKKEEGSRQGDSLETAGASIRKLKQAMERYVFPPQFDFLKNTNVKPIAMYVFEFEYELDRDDLSYIWQNLAPRDYKKATFQNQMVAHNLGDNEIINEEVLTNRNLRWMVFKIKQRALTDYYDLIPDQIGSSTRQIGDKKTKQEEYTFGYNWPYDYLSFVELIKMDVDILLKKDPNKPTATPKRRKRGNKKRMKRRTQQQKGNATRTSNALGLLK